LYDKLKKTNLLPFTKIKTINSTITDDINNFTVTYIHTSLPVNNYESNIISSVNEAYEDSVLETEIM
jgi:hypothetical protein